jgi:hypothetical protein
VAVAAVGLSLAAGVAYGGWYWQSGKWYFTPDIGTESTYKGVPNPETQPSYVQWTLTTVRYGCACRNRGGNFASEVVSVEPVTLTAVDAINGSDFLDKKKGIALAAGHIDTDSLCTPDRVTCQNPNWYLDPAYNLVYEFTGTTEAFLYNKKTTQYEPVAGSRQEVTCELSDTTASPLNLPAPGTPYNCY